MALINLGQFNNHVITHSVHTKCNRQMCTYPHIHCKNLFIYTKSTIAMIEHFAHTSSHTYRDTFRSGRVKGWSSSDMLLLLCITEWNHMESETPIYRYWLGRLVKSVKMKNGYIPMLNTKISSCHIFPKRAEYNSLRNSDAQRATTSQD